MELAKKTVRLLILFTLGFALVFIVSNLLRYDPVATSFPWWSPFVFALFYFGPTLAFEGVLYGVLLLTEKWKK